MTDSLAVLLLQGLSVAVLGYDIVVLLIKDPADEALFTGTGIFFPCIERRLRMSKILSIVLIKSPSHKSETRKN
jgi:hypothetical protein